VFRWFRPLCVALLLGLPPSLEAQTGLTGAAVEGRVRDDTGQPLRGATVEIADAATGFVRTTVTDADGRYRFAALPVASYRVRAEHGGFHAATRAGLVATVGQVLVIDVTLAVAFSEAVSAGREGDGAGLAGAAVSTTVGPRPIETLPTNGRDYVAFTLLTPGVVAERTPPTGPTSSSGLSFAGQRARANHILVDGFDNDDAYTGAVAASFSQDAVLEFQVLTASAPAEFGHASGGTVNTVTKSGTNDLHGGAYVFLRDDSLNSKEHFAQYDVFGNPIDAPKAPFHQAQWGATLGGPVRRDRTFFFLSFERLATDASNFVTIDPGAAAAIGSAGFPIALGNAPYFQGTWSGLAKIDHRFTTAHRLVVRGHASDRTNENVEAFGGIVARSHGAVQERLDWGIAVAASDLFAGGWLNEARLQAVHGDQGVYSLDPLCGHACRDVHDGGPEVTLPGIAVFGRQLNTPQVRSSFDLRAADTLTRALGRHTLKAGFDLDLVWRDGGLAQDFGGRYVFTALPAIPGLSARPLTALGAFEAGLPALYFQGYGDTTASGTSRLFAAFVQDRWRLSPRFTVEAGLRYQRYALGLGPVRVSDRAGTTFTYDVPDRGDFAPRVSATFDPTGGGRTTFRGTFGVFHEDPLFLVPLVTSIVDGQTLSLLRAGLPLSAEAWRSPGHRLPEPAVDFPSVVQVAAPGFRPALSRQLSIGWTQELWPRTTLSVDALAVRARHLTGVVDFNPLVPALGPGRRPDDRDGRPGTSTSVNEFLDYGDGWYEGLVVSARHRMGNGFEAQLAYTLSAADDTVSDLVGQMNIAEDSGLGRDPRDPAGPPLGFDPASFRGPSAVDQRHRVVLAALGRLPWGLELSGIVTVGSGRPFTALSGVDSNGDGLTATDRARRDPGNPATRVRRNGERLPGTATVDARLSRSVALPRGAAAYVMVEAFNLFDRVGYTDVNNVFGPGAFPADPQVDSTGRATYGRFTKAYAPRQVQIALRLIF
jgi:hypothetical protein